MTEERGARDNFGLGLWVPAFAGTTESVVCFAYSPHSRAMVASAQPSQ